MNNTCQLRVATFLTLKAHGYEHAYTLFITHTQLGQQTGKQPFPVCAEHDSIVRVILAQDRRQREQKAGGKMGRTGNVLN